MTSPKKDIIIFNPTPNEHEAVKKRVEAHSFKNVQPLIFESGMGKINAAFALAEAVAPRLAAGRHPLLVIGAGTSGSLSRSLASGDLIVSNSAIICDWRMEDEAARRCAPYGDINFRELSPELAEEMAITCEASPVTALLEKLGPDFKRGRILTSDTFVSGAAHKLRLGRDFSCLACDMESGAFAYGAQKRLGGLPWLNIRIVADTIDESLNDYVNMELDMVEILGRKTVELLKVLDDLL